MSETASIPVTAPELVARLNEQLRHERKTIVYQDGNFILVDVKRGKELSSEAIAELSSKYGCHEAYESLLGV